MKGTILNSRIKLIYVVLITIVLIFLTISLNVGNETKGYCDLEHFLYFIFHKMWSFQVNHRANLE